VPYLDVNESALFSSKRGMLTIAGATYPASLGVDPKLIMKDAIQDVNVLAARMNMGVKYRIGSPAHQGRTNTIMFMQRHHRQSWNKAGIPIAGFGIEPKLLAIGLRKLP
jgi:hypothetical protein